MNANELADELQKMLEDKSALFGWEIRCVENAEAMLRTIPALQAEIEALKDFAIWMTGCGYDFCQHEYFIERRDKLLVGKAQEKND